MNTMTQDEIVTEAMMPSADLFIHGRLPEPLTEEERRWLAEQLHAWPRRVHDERTCAIGALTDMATVEFARLMAERRRSTAQERALDDDAEWLRDEMIAAYKQGALDVHEAWVSNCGEENAPSRDPDFTEAAHDYAADRLQAKAPETGEG